MKKKEQNSWFSEFKSEKNRIQKYQKLGGPKLSFRRNCSLKFTS